MHITIRQIPRRIFSSYGDSHSSKFHRLPRDTPPHLSLAAKASHRPLHTHVDLFVIDRINFSFCNHLLPVSYFTGACRTKPISSTGMFHRNPVVECNLKHMFSVFGFNDFRLIVGEKECHAWHDAILSFLLQNRISVLSKAQPEPLFLG